MTERYPPVLSKRDFVKRYQIGEFGNCSPTWDTYEEWMKDRDRYANSQLYHIRNRVKGGDTWYNVHKHAMMWRWDEAISSGLKASDLYISAMAPHKDNLIQGEVMQDEKGLQLYASRVIGLPMREALLDNPFSIGGVNASQMLKTLMCPNSWDWLNVLLDRYPGHVVEFSTFSRFWGTLPRHNTCYWEVRLY